jgi:hypothetical protein
VGPATRGDAELADARAHALRERERVLGPVSGQDRAQFLATVARHEIVLAQERRA